MHPRRWPWLLLPALSACVAAPRPLPPPAASPTFDPVAFFTGRTHGEGTLSIIGSRPRRTVVSGSGTVAGDGTLHLRQRVEEEGKPGRTREWRIAAQGGGRYAGTLSDAQGQVTGDAMGNRLHLRFRSGGGLRIDQRLILAPGGRTAYNRLTVRKVGIVVARLDETITKLP